MVWEALDEFTRYASGHRVVFLQVIVLIYADHHLRDQRTIRMNCRHCHVLLQRLIEISRLLMTLGHFILGVRRQRMIRKPANNDTVRLDGFLPVFLLLCELAKQIAHPCRVFFIRKILRQLEQHPSAVIQVFLSLLHALEFLLGFEQFKITLCDMKPGLRS